ncbi:MAG: hypothetical protein IT438_10125 [Phycisphaerales bacterium]|nr:hypothetical protein [Phycisphaerales bacterium]
MLTSHLSPRHLLIALPLLALMLIAGVGCSTSSTQLLADPGTFAYEGDTVRQRGTMLERGVLGSAENEIDLADAKNPHDTYERVLVFIEPAEVGELGNNASTFSRDQLASLVARAADEAVPSFGRFITTTDRSRAHILIKPSLHNVNAFRDTISSSDDFLSKYGPLGTSVAANENINREALEANVNVTIACGPADPTGVAGDTYDSERALGRLVANKGQSINNAQFTIDRYSGTGTSYFKAEHADLNPNQLTLAIRTAVEGAIAVIVSKQSFDTRVWAPVPANSTASTERDHKLRRGPRSAAGAPGRPNNNGTTQVPDTIPQSAR